MLKPTLAALLVLALVAPTRAEQPSDARALLQKVGQACRALSSYQIEGLISIKMGGLGMNLDVPWSTAGDRSGRARVYVENPQSGLLVVCDGRQLFTYRPSLNQYTRELAALPADSTTMPLPPPGSPFGRYFNLTQELNDAQIAGEQVVEIGGKTSDCWVVRCDLTPAQALAADSTARAIATFWVDKTSLLVRRDSTDVSMRNPQTGAPLLMEQVTTFRLQRVNESLPDSLFAFTAPAGAREVKTFSMPGAGPSESDLVGKKAPPFTLANLQGRSVSLAAYKGRVVVLDFWATWCNPCRIEMPRVEKLHKELKSKGLVVLGVNCAERVDRVRSFLAQNPYSFTILLDRDGAIATKYGAIAIPTLVVVGKDGTVQSYFRGVQDDDELRRAVGKAMAAKGPATTARPAVRRGAAPVPKSPASTAPKSAPAAPKKP